MAFDFPTGVAIDQVYTSPDGVKFTWDGEKWMQGSASGVAGSGYVMRTGDTMQGFLTANADPTAPLHYATKQYTDTKVLPPVGPDGTALVVQGGFPVWGAPIEGGNF